MTGASNARELLEPLRRLQARIRDTVVAAFEHAAAGELETVAEEGAGDTLYAIDRIGERALVEFLGDTGLDVPIVLIGEGLEPSRLMRNGSSLRERSEPGPKGPSSRARAGERVRRRGAPALRNQNRALVFPEGASEDDAPWRVIIDPIDGTRGAMYQKRSAWVLTGVAPNRGAQTNLADIELALQTEIPLVKQHLSDAVWAVAGGGVEAERFNRLSGESHPIALAPSKAPDIAHGFAMIARFFPGAREELAAIDEEIVEGALGPVQPGKAHCFEDQYICSGGQLYELMAGRDRFVADLRPLMEPMLQKRGTPLGICCHPYDLCTELVAREAGVIVTDPWGEPLSAPLDVATDVAWVGYANESIRAQIEPLLQNALRRRGLAP